jgi:uncharacterized protein YjiS (DUF1127 family)
MPTTLTLRTSPSPFAIARRPVARTSGPTLLAEANRLLLRGIEALERWDARFHQRRDLHALPDHLLHDIGRSRADVEAEATKPFWRA